MRSHYKTKRMLKEDSEKRDILLCGVHALAEIVFDNRLEATGPRDQVYGFVAILNRFGFSSISVGYSKISYLKSVRKYDFSDNPRHAQSGNHIPQPFEQTQPSRTTLVSL